MTYQSFLLLALAVALVAAVLDARSGHIPNWLTLGTLVVAPLLQALAGGKWAFVFSLLGAASSALLPLLLYRAGGMGGGDVKLLASLGALLQPLAGFHAVTYAFVAGALWAVVLLARQKRLLPALGVAARLFKMRRDTDTAACPPNLTELRFGPAIGAGTLLAVIVCWRGA